MVALQSDRQCEQFSVVTLNIVVRKSTASHGLQINGELLGVGKNQGAQT